MDPLSLGGGAAGTTPAGTFGSAKEGHGADQAERAVRVLGTTRGAPGGRSRTHAPSREGGRSPAPAATRGGGGRLRVPRRPAPARRRRQPGDDRAAQRALLVARARPYRAARDVRQAADLAVPDVHHVG